MKNVLKSIGAVLGGILTGAILSVLTDLILEKTGLMETDPFNANPTWLIIGVVVYRAIYNMAGAYVTARLAPDNPMKHALILGVLGLAVSIAGTIVMWHIPPHWYPITLDIIALPCTWIGGTLGTNQLAKLKVKG
jgi:hypothetical protein